ncbi:MAG TPA: dihydrodipicolinate synthase family protein, partial [Ignavibacteriaceae bacterium]
MTDYLTGIFPPIPTPFNSDEEINFNSLKSNLSLLQKFPLKGYVVFGSNGESVFLTREEKVKLISTVREHIPADKTLIAGTGSDSIKETINLSNEAAKSGANFALVITPFFFQKEITSKALISYYIAIADRVKIPIIIYNVPKFTNVNITPATVCELTQHPNIKGIKNSTENIVELSEMVFSSPKSFSVIAGTGSVLLPALQAGCSGGILALANIAPEECCVIQKKYSEGKINEAREIQSRMIPVNRAVTATYGVAGLKAAMELLGYFGGLTRRPLQPL